MQTTLQDDAKAINLATSYIEVVTLKFLVKVIN